MIPPPPSLALSLLLKSACDGSTNLSQRSSALLDNPDAAALQAPDTSPNIGMWWYFFAEVFPSWREPFKLAYIAAWIVPALLLSGKLHKNPLLLFTCHCIIISLLKPHPTVADAAMFMVGTHAYAVPCITLHMYQLALTLQRSWKRHRDALAPALLNSVAHSCTKILLKSHHQMLLDVRSVFMTTGWQEPHCFWLC